MKALCETTRYDYSRHPRSVAAIAFCLACLALLAAPECWAQGTSQAGQGGKKGGSGAAAQANPAPKEAAIPASVLSRAALSAVVGRPTATAVTLNLLADRDEEVLVEYGPAATATAAAAQAAVVLPSKTAALALKAGIPSEVTIEGLKAGTEYAYRLQTRVAATAAYSAGPTGRFVTQRPAGSTFSFDIIGDSHPERAQQFDPGLYAQLLSRSAALPPDFFMTIGDDFSVDTLQTITKEAVDAIYLRQRLYLSLVGSGSPVYLVNGNHEQASLANLSGSSADVALWAQNARNSNFAQPAPDGFYSGDAEKVSGIGYLRDYYAWTWGDALFVVIDPYWHSKTAVDNVLGGGDKRRDLWEITLGDTQYAWLKSTLESSKATFKFVFSHHVSGTGRGGIEGAGLYEWGGKSPDGTYEFPSKRPGWPEPIQALMARTKVTAYVQGHDHVFANQVLDGVAYISLPEPADPNYALNNADAYKTGEVLPSSGRVRFTVGPKLVTIDYLREWLPGDEPSGVDVSKPAFHLEIPAASPPGPSLVNAALAKAGMVVGSPPPPGSASSKQPGQAGKDERPAKGDKAAPADKLSGGNPATGGASAAGAVSAAGAAPAAGVDRQEGPAPSPSGELHGGTLVEFPGATSVGLATAFGKDVTYYYEYGGTALDRKTAERKALAGAVARDRITGLSAGTSYRYRLAVKASGETAFSFLPEGSFATAKASGQSFTFLVEADPHFDGNSSGSVYDATLARMAAETPDFVVDLGDTAMVEKLATDEASYLARMKLVRSYWDSLGSKTAFLMVAGNHDGEQGWPAGPQGGGAQGGGAQGSGKQAAATKARPSGPEVTAMRETWLVGNGQAPSDTYSVFSDTVYAWEWGGAQFIVLDPYIAVTTKPTEDGWTWTLGKAQYDWLTLVLSKSKASLRFVFIHNLLGGYGKDARGGADWAGLYEWGGDSADGKDDFPAKRPGWAMPLDGLFAKYGVDIVFHGHDHFYAKEEAGGIVYQEVPQPSLAREQPPSADFLAEYGYSKGDFLPSPGYLRVTVEGGKARIDYLRGSGGNAAATYTVGQ